MNNYIILNKNRNIKRITNLLKSHNLLKSFKNSRTEIWENDDLQISIDKSIIRVLIFSEHDLERYIKLLTKG